MTGIALALLVVMPTAAAAQGIRWESQVRDKLKRAFVATGGEAQVLRVSPLNAEESDVVHVELRAGVTYAILATCDDDCSNLELVLATATGGEFAIDRHGEAFPLLKFTPRDTARYRVRVAMRGCGMNPCWYALGLVAAPH